MDHRSRDGGRRRHEYWQRSNQLRCGILRAVLRASGISAGATRKYASRLVTHSNEVSGSTVGMECRQGLALTADGGAGCSAGTETAAMFSSGTVVACTTWETTFLCASPVLSSFTSLTCTTLPPTEATMPRRSPHDLSLRTTSLPEFFFNVPRIESSPPGALGATL